MKFVWILLIGLLFGFVGWWQSQRSSSSCSSCKAKLQFYEMRPPVVDQPNQSALSVTDNDSLVIQNEKE